MSEPGINTPESTSTRQATPASDSGTAQAGTTLPMQPPVTATKPVMPPVTAPANTIPIVQEHNTETAPILPDTQANAPVPTKDNFVMAPRGGARGGRGGMRKSHNFRNKSQAFENQHPFAVQEPSNHYELSHQPSFVPGFSHGQPVPPKEPTIRCNNEDAFKNHEYAPCDCMLCGRRNRSVCAKPRFDTKGQLPRDLESRLKAAMAKQFGPVEDVKTLPSSFEHNTRTYMVR